MIKKILILASLCVHCITGGVTLSDLFTSLTNDTPEKFEALLQKLSSELSQSPDGLTLEQIINQKWGYPKRTLLFQALSISKTDGPNPFVEILLRFHANPNMEENAEGFTPLIHALVHHPGDVSQLIRYGADVNTPYGRFPLEIASLEKQNPLITLELLRHGANPNFYTQKPLPHFSNEEPLAMVLVRTARRFKFDEAPSECFNLVLLFGGDIKINAYLHLLYNYELTKNLRDIWRDDLSKIYNNSQLILAVLLAQHDLRQLLGMASYYTMNQQQRINHVRSIRRQYGSTLNGALALAIGQRNVEAVRLLLHFANPLDPIPTVRSLRDPSHTTRDFLNMNSKDLIEFLLEHPSHFTHEQNERYEEIAYAMARVVALHARTLLPYNQQQHILPTEIVLRHIISSEPTRFSRIVEEVYETLTPNFRGIPQSTERLYMFNDEELARLLWTPSMEEVLQGATQPATEDERFAAVQQAVEHVKLDWVQKLLPLINPTRLSDLLRVAQSQVQQLAPSTHGIIAQEIADLITERIRMVRPFMSDYPTFTEPQSDPMDVDEQPKKLIERKRPHEEQSSLEQIQSISLWDEMKETQQQIRQAKRHKVKPDNAKLLKLIEYALEHADQLNHDTMHVLESLIESLNVLESDTFQQVPQLIDLAQRQLEFFHRGGPYERYVLQIIAWLRDLMAVAPTNYGPSGPAPHPSSP